MGAGITSPSSGDCFKQGQYCNRERTLYPVCKVRKCQTGIGNVNIHKWINNGDWTRNGSRFIYPGGERNERGIGLIWDTKKKKIS